MIVLDTNVVSEPLKPMPDPRVVAWLDAQEPETLYLSTVSLAELLDGLERLPKGQRRTALQLTLTRSLDALFAGRLLSFDRAAALAWPRLNAHARAAGKSVSFADGQIAAIAAANGFAVASRDPKPFEATGIAVVNPWSA